jgi:diacylglycerol kinase (ATP)
MRITLIHNPSSGDTPIKRAEIVSILDDLGYQTAYYSTRDGKKRKKDWRQALDTDPGDLVVAAGGDGTVRKVALQMAGSPAPFAILPLGLANNVAKTLGIHGEIAAIARGWRSATPRPFDIGLIDDGGSEQPFVESLGGGLLATLIARAQDEVEEAPAVVGRETDRAVYLLREIARGAEPSHWGLALDGRDASGSYFGVEVMNVRFGGPNIPLAPEANAGDGLLDVVTIGSRERDQLVDYLSGRLEHGAAEPLQLQVHRARTIELTPPKKASLHLDDDIWQPAKPTLELRVRAAACRVVI